MSDEKKIMDELQEKAADAKEKAAERSAEVQDKVEKAQAEAEAKHAENVAEAKANAAEANAAVKDAAADAKEKAEDAKADVKEKVADAKADMKEKAADIKEKAEDAKADVKEKVADVREKAEERSAEVQDKVEKAQAEAEAKHEEDVAEARSNAAEANEAVKDAVEEVKSHKEKIKEEKAAKKAAQKAKAEEEAAKASKAISTKYVTLIAIGICIVAVLGLVLFLNKGEQSVYEKISNYDKYIKLGKYKGLTYTKEEIKVTKKDIKAEIDNRLAAKATTKDSKKGEVKDGDNVNISYEGKIGGKTFDGGTADNQTLTIGSGAYIDGFEEGLIGKKVGDTVTLDLKFPKDYSNKDVAGKDVTFTVKINSKQVTNTPKYDEKFIKENSKYNNKKDYEASIKKELEDNKKQTAEDTAKQSLWSEAVENAEVKKYPKGAVTQEKDAIIEQYKLMAQNYNMEWEDFLKTYMQSSEKEFEKQAKTYGKSVAKQKLVLYAIADKEKIKISNKEYKKRLKEMLKNAGMTEKQFKEQYNMTLEEYAEKNDFKANFLSEKVNDFLYKNAKAKKA